MLRKAPPEDKGGIDMQWRSGNTQKNVQTIPGSGSNTSPEEPISHLPYQHSPYSLADRCLLAQQVLESNQASIASGIWHIEQAALLLKLTGKTKNRDGLPQ